MSETDLGRVGVWGASGAGKSTYIKGLLRDRGRVLVFDPLEEYGREGFDTVRSVREAKDAMAASFDRFRLAVVPPGGRESLYLDRLAMLARFAQEPFKEGRYERRLLFVVEEMNLSFPVHGGAERAPAFADLCSRGRHYGIDLVGASQRIAEVSTRFRGNASETVTFRQGSKPDVEAAVSALGFTDPAAVRGLADHEYIRVKGGQETRGKNSL